MRYMDNGAKSALIDVILRLDSVFNLKEMVYEMRFVQIGLVA